MMVELLTQFLGALVDGPGRHPGVMLASARAPAGDPPGAAPPGCGVGEARVLPDAVAQHRLPVPDLAAGPALRHPLGAEAAAVEAEGLHRRLDGGYQAGATGRAQKVCAGDTVLSPNARIVRYGTTWHGGPFTCKSSSSGLRCKNRSGHGFFLSRQHSYRF
jgi:hypothetical protein